MRTPQLLDALVLVGLGSCSRATPRPRVVAEAPADSAHPSMRDASSSRDAIAATSVAPPDAANDAAPMPEFEVAWHDLPRVANPDAGAPAAPPPNGVVTLQMHLGSGFGCSGGCVDPIEVRDVHGRFDANDARYAYPNSVGLSAPADCAPMAVLGSDRWTIVQLAPTPTPGFCRIETGSREQPTSWTIVRYRAQVDREGAHRYGPWIGWTLGYTALGRAEAAMPGSRRLRLELDCGGRGPSCSMGCVRSCAAQIASTTGADAGRGFTDTTASYVSPGGGGVRADSRHCLPPEVLAAGRWVQAEIVAATPLRPDCRVVLPSTGAREYAIVRYRERLP